MNNERDVQGQAAHNKPVQARATASPDSLPWSYCIGLVPRLLVSTAAGILIGLIGTLTYRAGAAQNVPYGLVIALLVVALSAWCARSRSGITGLVLHLIVSSLVVSILSSGANGNILVPVFTVPMPFFSQNAGYIWLFGMILIQLAVMFMPSRWFAVNAARDESKRLAGGRVRNGNDTAGEDHAGSANTQSRKLAQ